MHYQGAREFLPSHSEPFFYRTAGARRLLLEAQGGWEPCRHAEWLALAPCTAMEDPFQGPIKKKNLEKPHLQVVRCNSFPGVAVQHLCAPEVMRRPACPAQTCLSHPGLASAVHPSSHLALCVSLWHLGTYQRWVFLPLLKARFCGTGIPPKWEADE